MTTPVLLASQLPAASISRASLLAGGGGRRHHSRSLPGYARWPMATWPPGLGCRCASPEPKWSQRSTGNLSPTGPVALFGRPANLSRYPATAAAPRGIHIWYVAGVAELVQIDEPVPTQPVTEALGPPEAEVDSLLGSSRRQLVYAGRGLTVHVSTFTGVPYRLYGYAPCPVEQFLNAPLRWVSSTRRQR